MSNINFIKNGNIFTTSCEYIVCPVNCFGVMGAGLAKQFRDKEQFTADNNLYKDYCVKGFLAPGGVIIPDPIRKKPGDKSAIYVATKMDWRDPSKMDWIENGLFNLYRALKYYEIGSVAIPAIGAGLGGLPWPPIEIMIKNMFEVETIKVEVYSPL